MKIIFLIFIISLSCWSVRKDFESDSDQNEFSTQRSPAEVKRRKGPKMYRCYPYISLFESYKTCKDLEFSLYDHQTENPRCHCVLEN